MTAKEDDQFSEPIDDLIEEAEPVKGKKKAKVVAAEPDEKVQQSREKAKKKKQNAFFAYLKKADPIALTCFIVILLASVVVIGSYINSEYIDVSNGGSAASGSTVEVEYVGSYLGFYDEGGVIFDTNIEGVQNNEAMVFSGAYTTKESFDYLSFTIGGGQVLKAFGDACTGYSAGDIVRVSIPASDITDSSDIRQSYGKVDRKENVDPFVTIPMHGTMSLDAYNRLCKTSYTADTFPTPATASPIKDVDFIASYDKVDDVVNYTFVGVTAKDAAEMTVGTPIKISDVTGDNFKLTYTFTAGKNSVLRGIDAQDGFLTVIFVEHLADAEKVSTYIDDFSDLSESKGNPEPKGETMFFWIKIKSVA